jgi:hypothetical protein
MELNKQITIGIDPTDAFFLLTYLAVAWQTKEVLEKMEEIRITDKGKEHLFEIIQDISNQISSKSFKP